MLANALTLVARLMHTSVEHEHLIESTRLVLADRQEFDPEQTFLRMDRNRKGCITPQDIVSFMKQNASNCNLKEA